MRPLALSIEGFTCFRRRQQIDFRGLTLFAIEGPTGAGKSSLLDALALALYGEVPRLGKQGLPEMIALGMDRLAVVLDFAVGERSYRAARVVRRRGAASAQLDELTGATALPICEGVRAVNEAAERLLGIGSAAFQQAILLPQGKFAAFLHAEPHKRREVLRELLRLRVYEAMQQRAGERARDLGVRVAALEQQLQQGYADATEAAAEALAREATELEQRVATLAAAVKAEGVELEALRRLHALTLKHDELQREQKDHAAAASRLEPVRARLAAAERAAALAPLLAAVQEGADAVEDAEGRWCAAQAAQAGIGEALATAQQRARAASAAAAALPALQASLRSLAAAAALVPVRDEQRREADARAGALARLEDERRAARSARAAAQASLATHEQTVQALTDQRAACGHDPAAHDTLTRALPRASELAQLRAQHRRAAGELDDARKRARESAAGRDRLAAALASATALAAESSRALAAASQDLALVEDAHRALVLREHLTVGQDCPVCQRRVDEFPARLKPPGLAPARSKAEGARAALEQAEKARQAAALQAAAAEAKAEDAAAALHRAEAGAAEQQEALTQAESALSLLLGRDLPRATGETLEAAAVAAQARAEARASHHARLAAAERAALEQRQLAAEAAKAAEATLAGLRQRIEEAEREAAGARRRLEAVDARIRASTDVADPVAAEARMNERVRGLEEELRQAQVEHEQQKATAEAAARTLHEAHTRREEVQRAHAAILARALAAATAAGFATVADATAAVHAPERLRSLEQEVAAHDRLGQTLATLEAKLAAELAGRRAEADAVARCATRLEAAESAHRQALREQGELRQRRAHLEASLARAAALRVERSEAARAHALHGALAAELRSDRFQAHLLDDVFRRLVAGAAVRLQELTQRYALAICGDRFLVIDHDNAGAQRSAATLSGGETFLLSLSLALELSEQIQRASGAVRLDSLFIDEGFGTLDPRTLDVVAGALEVLSAGDRMVGVITHRRELTDRLPARLQVERDADGACVQRTQG